jgi:hypothetical protein
MIASGVGSAGSSAAGLRSSTRLHEVFVSYSSRDKPVADAIVARLEQAGIRCWVAPRDVLPGMNWAHAIVEAIGSTRLMVVVLSGEANRSPQVLREVERAIATGAVVIPFRVEAVEPTDAMAYYLASEHWLDALTPPLDDHIATLAQVVEAFLERAPEPATTAGSAAPDLDPLDRVYPASSPVTPTARGHRRGWLLVAGGILAVAGIVGAAVMLTTRTAPEPTGATATSGEPAASGDTLEPPHDATTNPPDPETSGGTDDDGSQAQLDRYRVAANPGLELDVEVDESESHALLDRLHSDCAAGVPASCSRLWIESEGHPQEAELDQFVTDQLWRFSAIERWGIDIPDDSLPTRYGAHAVLDELYDECGAGDEIACTELLWTSPLESEYEGYASQNFDHRPSVWDLYGLKSYWLVLTPRERADECVDFDRDAAGLVSEWEDLGLQRDTVLQFYNDHCGVEREPTSSG